jgi:hypothetical protein
MIGCREKLTNIFGRTFPNDRLSKAADLAHQIHAWRVGSNQKEKSGSKEVGSISGEFGSNLGFQVPSARPDDFEYDSDDDEDDWEDLGTATNVADNATAASNASAVFDQTDVPVYKTFKEEWHSPTSDGVGGITLRWFYKACEQAGQFSGTDLAMALYHVLDSERSGDEVRIGIRYRRRTVDFF